MMTADDEHSEAAFLDLPDYRAWSMVAVRMLQGVVYSTDTKVWSELLDSQRPLREYFARIGLAVELDETNGYAYLRQLDADLEVVDKGYSELPRLFRRSRLGYGASLICVMLREELRRFETEEVDSEICTVSEEALFEQWKATHPKSNDEAKQQRAFLSALKSASESGFVRKLKGDPPTWEVLRVLKARLDAHALEKLRDDIVEYLNKAEGN